MLKYLGIYPWLKTKGCYQPGQNVEKGGFFGQTESPQERLVHQATYTARELQVLAADEGVVLLEDSGAVRREGDWTCKERRHQLKINEIKRGTGAPQAAPHHVVTPVQVSQLSDRAPLPWWTCMGCF